MDREVKQILSKQIYFSFRLAVNLSLCILNDLQWKEGMLSLSLSEALTSVKVTVSRDGEDSAP